MRAVDVFVPFHRALPPRKRSLCARLDERCARISGCLAFRTLNVADDGPPPTHGCTIDGGVFCPAALVHELQGWREGNKKGTELTPSTHPDAVSCRLEAFQSRLASPPRTSVVIVHRHRFSESPRTPCLRASARVLREKSQPTCPNLRVRWLLRRAGERLRPPGIELPLASARASFVVLFGWCTVCAVPCFYFSFSFLPFVFYSAAFFDGVIVPLFLRVLSCGVW